jgi:hypothetical protein
LSVLSVLGRARSFLRILGATVNKVNTRRQTRGSVELAGTFDLNS